MIPILFGFFVGALVAKNVYKSDTENINKDTLDEKFSEIYANEKEIKLIIKEYPYLYMGDL